MTDDARAKRTQTLAAAQAKCQAKTDAAEKAIRTLVKRSEPITFQAVQREAGVSHAFLYNHPDLRGRIERLRAQARPAPTPAAPADEQSTLVLALTGQITRLKKQHGEELQAAGRPGAGTRRESRPPPRTRPPRRRHPTATSPSHRTLLTSPSGHQADELGIRAPGAQPDVEVIALVAIHQVKARRSEPAEHRRQPHSVSLRDIQVQTRPVLMQICLTGAVLRLEGPAKTPCLAARCRIDLDSSPPGSDRRGQSVTIDLPATRVSTDHHHERRHSDCLSLPPRHGLLLTLHRSQKCPELECQPETETKPGITGGIGKTHLAIGLGVKAAHAGYSVLFDTSSNWIVRLAAAHQDGRLERELKKIRRYKLIIIDEVGYIPFDQDAANLFYQLIASRYEQGSVMITSNLPFGRWGETFSDGVVAAAMIDRLVHHAEVLTLTGDSYRTRQRRELLAKENR
ncbi:DUF6262 family protein [Streptomyces sp. NPDC059582]|uniref:DUF6262 family protein n=1 Tax=Streptomyces sp. NPDC059582 TaxID=3346875 RepID=UPI0036AE782B